jgi:hypothetical protein
MSVATPDRFKQAVIVALAKRAANQCSNPDCNAITSGPTDDLSGSVNVGEAAHIYGANPGSARYEAGMVSADRADITNAIWLCATCHKLVDDDPKRYPPGLLFEWQRAHMERIAALVGKAGAEIRLRYERRHLEEFGKLSYLAERIITEKPNSWEYRLTGEMLRFEIAPIARRWSSLKRGSYVRPHEIVKGIEFREWSSVRLAEAVQLAAAFNEIVNVDFKRSWGDDGVAGNDLEIVETCRLYSELCAMALRWEEAVRFTSVDDVFVQARDAFSGAAGSMIDEAVRAIEYFADVFRNPKPGRYSLTLDVKLPEGWEENFSAAFARASEAYAEKQRRKH